MTKGIFTLIFAVIFSSIAFPGAAALKPTTSAITVMEGNSLSSPAGNDRKKKRKLKKKVRQFGRVYKSVKSDRQDKKKARKVQKKIRQVINIW